MALLSPSRRPQALSVEQVASTVPDSALQEVKLPGGRQAILPFAGRQTKIGDQTPNPTNQMPANLDAEQYWTAKKMLMTEDARHSGNLGKDGRRSKESNLADVAKKWLERNNFQQHSC